MIDIRTFVFVYGTLKAGHGNHHVLGRNPRLVGRATTHNKYRMLLAGFPVILEDPDGVPVVGEVYEVSIDILADLDRLEGEGRMYHRRTRFVRLGEAASIPVHLYEGDHDFWSRNALPQPKRNDDGTLEWKGYSETNFIIEHDDDEIEEYDPEDQSQGDVLGLDDEREQP